MSQEQEDVRSVYGIDWVKTLGGAFAAVTVAVLLSFLGAAGTLVGAALGSVVVTVATQLYSQGLERSRRAAASVQTVALAKVSVAQTEVLRAVRREDEGDSEAVTAHLEHADEKLQEARADLEGDPEEGSDDEATAVLATGEDGEPQEAAEPSEPDSFWARLKALGWKRVALAAGATFVVVMLALSAVELISGRSVSQLTGGSSGDGGTSLTNVFGGGDDTDEPSDGPGDDQPADPSDDTTQQPSDGTTEQTDEPTDDTTDETDEPTDEPTEEPTDEESTSPTTPTSPTTSRSPRG